MRLRFWLKESLTVMAAAIGGSAFYTFLMWFSETEPDLEGLFTMAIVYLIVFGAFMSLIMNVAAHSQHLSTALSFGSSRKEAMVGMQIFRLLPALVIAILSTVLFIIYEGQFQTKCLLIGVLSLAVSLILGTWGSFMGIMHSRFGVKALVAVLVSGLLILGGCTAVIIVTALSDNADAIFEPILSHPVFPWALGLIPLAFYGLSLIPEKKAIYTCSVKL